MRDALKKYKNYEGKAITKFSQLFLIGLITFGYLYFVLIWTPETYVSILDTHRAFNTIKVIITIVLSLYIAVQLDTKFFRAPKYSLQQIKDYELWNKFFLHFAFMKTGSGSEKAQVLEVLRYLEDSELKQTLTDVYEQTTTMKDAHNQIIEKYPYPQVKTFFAESEDALVKGADGNRLMQKTALNIDKYINDITAYEAGKSNSYMMSLLLICAVIVLTFLLKLGFAESFISLANTYTGFAALLIYFIALTRVFILNKTAMYNPLLKFGGEDNE